MALIKISNNKKRQLTTMAEQAIGLAGQGRFASALKLCDRADRLHRDFVSIMYVRGIAAELQQDHATACEWLGRACAAAPGRLQFQLNYATCLMLNKQDKEAAAIFPRILEQDPGLFELGDGYSSYGSVLDNLGEYRRALQITHQAMRANPDNDFFLNRAAGIHAKLLELDTALALSEKVRARNPDDVEQSLTSAAFLIQLGRSDEMHELLHSALRIDPGLVKALTMLLFSGNYDGREEDAARLRSLYETAERGSTEHINATFLLGSEANRKGQYAEAFNYWLEGNSQQRSLIDYDEEEQETLFHTAMASFPASRLSGVISSEASQAAPIFIVGMPRCGSTLLERSLTRHPALKTAGENDSLPRAIIGRMNNQLSLRTIIENLGSFDNNGLLAVGREYARRISDEYGIKDRVIDKSLNNFIYAGLIAMTLPNARIIHTMRNPMATCLSMFETHFVGGISYVYDLDELGRQYARYQKLMQYWREVLPSGVMIEASYENLVSNTEPELRRILKACNLEWHDDCLSPHKAKGGVNTASSVQVRKPIHQQSVSRWKHYEEQLAPLKQYLQP